MDYKLLLDTAVMAGEIMLRNGAETHRVEDTVRRMLSLSGLSKIEVFVIATGFMVTLDNKDMDSMTVVRRIESRGTNLLKVHAVNSISRKFCSGQMSLEDAFHEVREIYRTRTQPKLQMGAIVAITAGFTVMFGGSAADMFVSAATGVILAGMILLTKKTGMHMFISNIICAVLIAVCAYISTHYIPAGILPGRFHQETIIVGCIMPLVPGAAITNAILDTLYGDYISGSAKMLEAFLIASAIAIGIAIGLGAMPMIL